MFTVQFFFNQDGSCRSHVDHAFVVLDWDKDTLLIEDRPIFPNDSVDFILEGGIQVGQVQVFMHQSFVHCQDKGGMEGWIEVSVEGWCGMAQLL